MRAGSAWSFATTAAGVACASALPACSSSSSPYVPVAATAECPTNDGGATTLGVFDSHELPGEQLENVSTLTADDAAVYVVVDVSDFSTPVTKTTTNVYRVPACGGTRMLLGSRDMPSGGDVSSALVASNRVFLVALDGVYSLPTDGGAIVRETTAAPVVAIAVYGDDLYWIDGAPALWSVKTGGGNPARMVAQSFVSASWTSFAVDATRAYVTQVPLTGGGAATPPSPDDANGSILSIGLSDGVVSTLVSPLFAPGNVVVSGTALYWTSNMFTPSIDTAAGTGTIEGILITGGTVQVLANSEAPPPGPLMVVGRTVYWLDGGGPDGQTTVRALRSGGEPMTVPVDPPGLGTPIVLAPSGAYWFGSPDGSFGRSAL